ncbi:nascent polypeptide-associated complex subunit alpha, muscle-specific form-like isoform X12 [Zootermopsis nevadensis]|uniref:nascent polypeptide-associated complex subunit alpha, muscle-specific form-like isoform X12 n=1 Tax=Zootermopsis nevadensis TaxID=136037 RepID=UPI000B8E84FB|nr:nascent polypeptide-associated complex subunit alpha, muscle-specific form-like isoform X12 [Zootermopsis nevadensis]
MAMVNMNNLLNGKDSRWLQLEVCREFQRNKCTRPDTECKFAHPPANVEVQNGRVTACYDSIKGRCNREKPPCKYFHPPQHLKDQLLINGRNHLALKNALMQQMGLTPPGQPLIPGQVPAVVDGKLQFTTPLMLGQPLMQATNPYLTGMPQVGSTFSPYFTPGPVMPAILGPDPTSVGSPLSVVPQTVVTQQKMARSDRLEMDMKSVGSFYYESFAFPGMVPYKRPAADKSGMPVYQPSATTYQQLMQLQQPPFVPVSCEYSTPPATVTSSSLSPATPSCSSVASSSGGATEVGKVVVTELEETNSPVATDKLPQGSKPQISVTIPALPAPSSNQAAAPMDVSAAAAAKEAAQQSYAKAVKLAAAAAAVSNSLSINPLMALNYTGVALNKQAMAVMPPPPRYAPHVSGLSITPTTQLPSQFSSQFSYCQSQPNLLTYNRIPPPPTTLMSPYSFFRPQMMHAAPYTMVPQPPPTAVVGNGILNNMMAQYNPLATSTNNNNIITGVALQPYKKMKTT